MSKIDNKTRQKKLTSIETSEVINTIEKVKVNKKFPINEVDENTKRQLQIIIGKILDIKEKRIKQREDSAQKLIDTDPKGFFIKVRPFSNIQMAEEYKIKIGMATFSEVMRGKIFSKFSKTVKELKRALGL